VPVLTAAERDPWDTWHNGDPSVVCRDGRFYMAYSATGSDGPNGTPSCVMGAVSDDGVTWERTRVPLVMHPLELELPQTREARGALPGGGEQTCGSYHRPSLLFDDGVWKLWFDYYDVEPRNPWMVGYAEAAADQFAAEGAFKLMRVPGENPVTLRFPNPDVVRVGDIYHAFGDPHVDAAHEWTSRKLTHAISADGLDWTVAGHVEADPDSAAIMVPGAQVLTEDGRRWLAVWYACQRGGDPYNFRFERIRMMRVELAESGLPRGW
jgi:hypothetical protein